MTTNHLAYAQGRETALALFTKKADISMAVAGLLGMQKAQKSKKYRNEEVEGFLRGAGGWVGGNLAGGILGVVAGTLLGDAMHTPGMHRVDFGPTGLQLAGGIGGALYGGYKGYQGLTSKYNNT